MGAEQVRSTHKRDLRWLARPRKRHYTFARRPRIAVMVQVRYGADAASKR
jgi:hypothetical protein